MNIRLTAALLAAFSSAAFAQNDPFILETLQKHYPENAEATKEYRENLQTNEVQGVNKAVCQLRESTAEEAERQDDHYINEGSRFCMRFHSEKIIDNDNGKRRYMLFIGDNLMGAHGAGGLVAFMIFNGDDKTWTLADKDEYEVGAWGEVPTEWQWHEFAPNRWGVQGESGFAQMGYHVGVYNLLHDNGDKIRYQFIYGASGNDASRDCDEEPKKERAACRESLYSLESTFKLRPDLGAENGAYPIEILVNGEVGTKKQYKNQPYIFQYDNKEHQYTITADYPIKGI